jgi:integrase
MLRIARATTLGGVIKSTKTGRSRVVPLTDPVVEALSAWRKQVLRQQMQKSEFVFGARQTGRPLNVRRVGRLFRELLRQAKVGRFKLYDLRHTYASHLLDQGIKPVDVADVLGHKNVATTLAFYAHRVPRDMGYIAERLTAARRSNGDLNR